MLIEWPEVFYHDDSCQWRFEFDYEKRMKLIAWHASLNFDLIR